MHSAEHTSGRIPALDGVRGLAIGLVLCWHFIVSPLRGGLQNHVCLSRIIDFGRFSWSGVDLFFVLSGFLIGGILLDASQSPAYFSTFYARRAYRIIPPYAALILATVALIPHFGHLGWPTYANEFLYYVLFLQNFRMAGTGSFGPLGLGMTWSLAVEEQFYLTLPLIVRNVSRRILVRLLLGAVVAAPLLRIAAMQFLKMSWIAAYVLLPCRADALCLGVLIAVAMRDPLAWAKIVANRKYVYLGFAITASAGLWLMASNVEPFAMQLFGLEYSLLALLYSFLLMSTLLSPWLSSLFSFTPFRLLGSIAYGLYLYQSLVGFVVERTWAYFKPAGPAVNLQTSVLSFVLSLGLATISWKYFEKPLVKRGHRYQY
jgi:peptidoglycan/LPS O-acetylase OafA/YrhL